MAYEKVERETRLTCCENRQKNWYKNWGVIKHTFQKRQSEGKKKKNITKIAVKQEMAEHSCVNG